MEKKSLLSTDVYKDCLTRIEKLTTETKPHWGSMTVAQMLAHCAEIQEVTNGKELKNTPFIAKLFRDMIRNMVVNDKPYPKNTKPIRNINKQQTVLSILRKNGCLLH